jgi:hypothetical protein
MGIENFPISYQTGSIKLFFLTYYPIDTQTQL